MTAALAAHLTAAIVRERYNDLVHDRAWYRANGPRYLGTGAASLAAETRIALRELVRIRWAARRSARAGR